MQGMATSTLEPAKARQSNPGSEAAIPHKRVWTAGVFGLCLLYAIIRYNVFKGVGWEHLPLYVVNKALALAGVCFIAGAYLIGKLIPLRNWEEERRRSAAKFCGVAGFTLVSMHALASMILLSPIYYEKFYAEGGKLNLVGELTTLFGVLSFACLAAPAITTLPNMYGALGGDQWKKAQRLGYWALALNCAHTFTMGFAGWFDLAAWPGTLPPITLLAFCIALLALLAKSFTSVSQARE